MSLENFVARFMDSGALRALASSVETGRSLGETFKKAYEPKLTAMKYRHPTVDRGAARRRRRVRSHQDGRRRKPRRRLLPV
jgi:hypothetical protein